MKFVQVLCLALLFILQTFLLSQSQASPYRNWEAFFGGMLTTFAIHESSHYLMAKLYGFDIGLDNVSIVYPDWDPTPREKMRIASAGFQGQWIVSELAFSRLEKKPDEKYYEGIVAGHVAISLAYTILKKNDTSDIHSMSSVSDFSSNELLLFLLVPASIDVFRLWVDESPKWLKNISIASKGLGITAIWKY